MTFYTENPDHGDANCGYMEGDGEWADWWSDADEGYLCELEGQYNLRYVC